MPKPDTIRVLGVPMPRNEFDAREIASKTIPGVGAIDCPQRDGCMLAVHHLIDEMRKEFASEMRANREEMGEIRKVLNQWVGSKGIRNSDSTPVGRGGLNVEAGPVKLKGKAWIIVALALAVVSIGAVAYVLGEWGRPTVVAHPK